MNETEIGKKPSDKKGVVLVVGFVFFLCAGILGGYLMKSSEPTRDCVTESVKTETTKTEVAVGDVTAKKETDVANVAYKTFSVPEDYFTFEYPDTWTYEKKINSPGETYAETDWIFYADKDKKQQTIDLHYPMSETAFDTCLKFDSTAEYALSQFTTNDPGTFITYLDCEKSPAQSYPYPATGGFGGAGGSNIFWQKGTLSEDKVDVSPTQGTEARITWENGVSSEIISHIAYSIKVVK